jgi:rhamnogalacturonyl hydrolase YesR
MDFASQLDDSIDRLQKWVEDRDYKGFDPGDGLNSFLRPLACGNRLVERVLLQIVWKAPINLRPLIGIKPMESTKGRGYMAWGYLLRVAATGDVRHRAKAEHCLDWLEHNQSAKSGGMAWGNHFDFVTRSGLNPAGSPIIVWTSLIGHAFLEAFEQTGAERYLGVANKACEWILSLPREKTESGSCLSYVPFAQSSIHNSNLLGAGVLARTWKHLRTQQLLDVATEAVRYSCSRQRSDGSWWYGEDPKYHWIDSFHTGYNLDSLLSYVASAGDRQYERNLREGLRYFMENFFETDGTPKYYHDRTQPIDIQCAAQAIETLSKCCDLHPSALALAEKVARWTIENMQDADGHFHYRKYPLLTARTPYIHWGQATMFKALATLISSRQIASAAGVP